MLTEVLQKEAETLEQELAQLETKRTRLDLIRRLLRTYGDPQNQPQLFNPTPGEAGERYNLSSLSAAIRIFFRDHPDTYYFPRQVRDEIVKGGFKTESPNL